jgi:large subunit ribosomal protein L6
MSRIGNKIIPFPKGVKCTVSDGFFHVEGPKGKLSSPIPAGITANMEDGQMNFSRSTDDGQTRSNHGLARALANNCILGVTQGFAKELEIIGVGYRVNVAGKTVELHLGYSHPINFPLPEGISASVEQIRGSKSIYLKIEGIDKQQVGQVAANIRRLRKPEPYKGKGIRYRGEQILRKAGKTGK